MTRRKEAGQALIFGVVTLGLLLMGFVGLGIDMGYLRYEKRLQQAAADSAAIAGASNLPTAFGGVTTAAQNAAATNGFSVSTANLGQCPPPAPAAAVGSVSVTINNPPCSGPHNADSNYVEVYVAQVQPTFFMRVLGITNQTVTARAVATTVSGGPNNGCLYTLGAPTKGIGVNITGSATLNATSCGIVDNGNFDPTGGAITVHAGSFSVADPNCSGSGCGKGTVDCGPTQSASNCPAYSSPPGPNPMAYLTPPSQPANSTSCPPPVVKKGKSTPVPCDVSASGGQTLQPGTYDSITIGGSKGTPVTLNPGIYYIDGSGGLSFSGGGAVTGTGVMFYFTCPPGTSPCSNGATLDARGGGNAPDIQLTAPSSTNCTSCAAQYDGILFYQDPQDTNAVSLGGDDNSNFTGTLYFPSSSVTFFGDAKSKGIGIQIGVIVTDSISFSGNPTVTLDGESDLPAGVGLVATATLVE